MAAQTQETTWTRPAGFGGGSEGRAASPSRARSASPGRGGQPAQFTVQTDPASGRPYRLRVTSIMVGTLEWLRFTFCDAEVLILMMRSRYYVDIATKQTVWTLPPGGTVVQHDTSNPLSRGHQEYAL